MTAGSPRPCARRCRAPRVALWSCLLGGLALLAGCSGEKDKGREFKHVSADVSAGARKKESAAGSADKFRRPSRATTVPEGRQDGTSMTQNTVRPSGNVTQHPDSAAPSSPAPPPGTGGVTAGNTAAPKQASHPQNDTHG